MAIVEMTKAQVIAVLKREDNFVQGTFIAGDIEPAAKCAVCAVGAVVRAALPRNASGTDVHVAIGQMSDAAYCEYLGSLSAAFEHAEGDFEEIRKAAIAHVREHFPARVRIDIGNAKPRRGMRVVG